MAKIKQLAGQTAVYGLGTILPRLLNYFLLTPVFTWIFKQGEYGVVTELYAYAAFLFVLLLYGMETAFFYFCEKKKDTNTVYGTALISILITSSIFVFLTIYFSDKISDLIDYPEHTEYIIWFAIIIGIDTFTAIPFAKLRKDNKAFKFAIIKLINVLINISLVFLFLILPEMNKSEFNGEYLSIFQNSSRIGYVFIANLITSCITLLLLSKEILSVKINVSSKLLKEMLIYAFPLLIVGSAGMINEVADKIMLKFLLVDKESAMSMVGVYGANYKLAMIMTIFVQMFRYAAEPFFFAQAKLKDAKNTYSEVMNYFVIFCLLIFLFVVLYIDGVKYFIGTNFHSGLKIVPIVLIANLFLGVFYNLSVWYKVNNITRYGAYIAIFGAVITIIVNVLLVPIIGFIGSAWATLICYFSMMVISYFWGRKFYKIDYNIKKLSVYFILAIILFYIKLIIASDNIIISLSVSTILIVFYLWFVDRQEKLIKRIVRR